MDKDQFHMHVCKYMYAKTCMMVEKHIYTICVSIYVYKLQKGIFGAGPGKGGNEEEEEKPGSSSATS